MITLVVTIILLLILVGVTINLVIGEHGILKRAEEMEKINKIAEIQEKLEIEKTTVFVDEKGKMTIRDYLEHIIKEEIITKEDIENTEENYAKRITVEGKYVFLIEEEDNGNIKITYEGEVGKLGPKIEIEITEITTTMITVKVTGKRMEKGEYSYYIKEIETEEEYKLKETKKAEEYTFEGLTPNKEYKIKIEARNKCGKDEKETKTIKTQQVYKVTYNIDTDDIKTELYGKGEDILKTSFTPKIQGWEFIGWREDTQATKEVINEKIMEEEEIILYGVFKKTITLSYNANGGTTTPAKQVGTRYYNNGKNINPSFILSAVTL